MAVVSTLVVATSLLSASSVMAKGSRIPEKCVVDHVLWKIQQVDRKPGHYSFKIVLLNSDNQVVTNLYQCTSNRGANYGATWGISAPGNLDGAGLFQASAHGLDRGTYTIYATGPQYSAAKSFQVTR